MFNSSALHLSLLDRSSSLNSRRTSSSNGSNKHDRNSYLRSYSSFNRSYHDKARERLTVTENWDLECSDPLRSMISGRTEGSLRCSQSMISRRQGEVQPRRVSTDNGNGTHTIGNGVSGIHKVSFDRDPSVSSGAEKRNFQSRSDFFNMMRKKSINSTSVSTDAGSDAEMADEADKIEELSRAQATPAENGRNVICNGEICTEAECYSQSEDEKDAAIYPNEEEKAFLRSLGWEESGGDGEALTEEEINAFYEEPPYDGTRG